jgi:hypothetical protein
VRPETADFLAVVDAMEDEDYSALVRAAVMFYVLDGWEVYWAFPLMPEWLKRRYWSSDLTAQGLALAEDRL